MLHHKSGNACGEIIHVQQILTELWSLTLRNFSYFSLSSQFLLYLCMDLNETWQGTTSVEVHVGRSIMFGIFGQSYDLWHFELLNILASFSLSSQLFLYYCMDLNESWQECYTTSLDFACGEIIHVWQILQELLLSTLRIFSYFSLSSQLLHYCTDLNETWQEGSTTSLDLHMGDNSCSSNFTGVKALEMFAL